MGWEIQREDGRLARGSQPVWQAVVAEKASRLLAAEAARRGVSDDVVLVLSFAYDPIDVSELVSLRGRLAGDAWAVQVVSKVSSYDVTVGDETWEALTKDVARLAAALWPFGSAEEETAALLARAGRRGT